MYATVVSASRSQQTMLWNWVSSSPLIERLVATRIDEMGLPLLVCRSSASRVALPVNRTRERRRCPAGPPVANQPEPLGSSAGDRNRVMPWTRDTTPGAAHLALSPPL